MTSCVARASATRSPSSSLTTRPRMNLRVREHVQFLLEHIPKTKPGLRVKHVNLFDLRDRSSDENASSWTRPCKCRRRRATRPCSRPLEQVLHEEKLAQVFAQAPNPTNTIWSWCRVWAACGRSAGTFAANNLASADGQDAAGDVLSWPYDGQSLRLFGKLKNNNYYRAFKLVS